jgi:hypothetical protein
VTDSELPLFLVCEDGDEYTQRFRRFLHREFRFVRVPGGRAAEEAIHREPAAGLLLDLDFRRLPPSDLLSEAGSSDQPRSPEDTTRRSASQGILILQYLRSRGVRLPALLFADLDDRDQVVYLERTLAPLSIVTSHEGLVQISARLRSMLEMRSA